MKYQEKNRVPKAFVAIPDEENDVKEKEHHFDAGNEVKYLTHTVKDRFKLKGNVQEFYSLLEM